MILLASHCREGIPGEGCAIGHAYDREEQKVAKVAVIEVSNRIEHPGTVVIHVED